MASPALEALRHPSSQEPLRPFTPTVTENFQAEIGYHGKIVGRVFVNETEGKVFLNEYYDAPDAKEGSESVAGVHRRSNITGRMEIVHGRSTMREEAEQIIFSGIAQQEATVETVTVASQPKLPIWRKENGGALVDFRGFSENVFTQSDKMPQLEEH